MRLTGTMTELDIDLDEYDWEIKEAVVTTKRIAIDWTEEDEPFCLIAHSTDGGKTYTGNYGNHTPNENWKMEITRYSGPDNAILLLAKWYQTDNGRMGACFIELQPKG
jgi:hypothetical protein